MIKLRAPPLRVWHPRGLPEGEEGRGPHWWVPDPSLVSAGSTLRRGSPPSCHALLRSSPALLACLCASRPSAHPAWRGGSSPLKTSLRYGSPAARPPCTCVRAAEPWGPSPCLGWQPLRALAASLSRVAFLPPRGSPQLPREPSPRQLCARHLLTSPAGPPSRSWPSVTPGDPGPQPRPQPHSLAGLAPFTPGPLPHG